MKGIVRVLGGFCGKGYEYCERICEKVCESIVKGFVRVCERYGPLVERHTQRI